MIREQENNGGIPTLAGSGGWLTSYNRLLRRIKLSYSNVTTAIVVIHDRHLSHNGKRRPRLSSPRSHRVRSVALSVIISTIFGTVRLNVVSARIDRWRKLVVGHTAGRHFRPMVWNRQ